MFKINGQTQETENNIFINNINKLTEPERLATFDSIHDFKRFTTNPIDNIEYNTSTENYNINRCFFNFNRIMCRGNDDISIEDSFLIKSYDDNNNNNNDNRYSNNPYPITSIYNTENMFCLLNLYKLADEDSLFIIKGTPKNNVDDTEQNVDNYKNITKLIVERGWCDVSGSTSFINTITDVSPVFRKYYIQNRENNNVVIDGSTNAVYRCLVSQETANDSASSLGKETLTNAFGEDNVLIEKEGQPRTYNSEKINSFFEPTLEGITDLSMNSKINFNTKLTIKDVSNFTGIQTLPSETFSISYSKTTVANPNERSIINKDINSIFPTNPKNVCNDINSCTNLKGTDNPTHSLATEFYKSPSVDNFSKDINQKIIARHFTRKRFGDVLQASLCGLINSKYNNDNERIKFCNLSDGKDSIDIIPKSAIFIGEDRMIIAYCLINKIPCIYDNKNYTILYMPKRETPIVSLYTNFATIPSQQNVTQQNVIQQNVTQQNTNNKNKLPQDVENNFRKRQRILRGGYEAISIDNYQSVYRETIWNEPYYFYKYLPFIKPSNRITKETIDLLIKTINNIDIQIINGTYKGNVLNLNVNSTILPMYYVSKYSSIPQSFIAQEIVNKNPNNQYTFINVFDNPSSTSSAYNQSILLSVTKTLNNKSAGGLQSSREIYFKSINGQENGQGNGQGNSQENTIEENTIEEKQIEFNKMFINYKKPTYIVNNLKLYDKNVKQLKEFFEILNNYEIYSIINEKNEVDFYDINDSGVYVAFDCFFYILFNNIISDFKEEINTVDYELLTYYLYKNSNNYYDALNEIFIQVTGQDIILDVSANLESREQYTYTMNYFNGLFKATINTRNSINKQMYDFFVNSNYTEQYNLAIANKFTHYGFTLIQNEFEDIINSKTSKNLTPITETPISITQIPRTVYNNKSKNNNNNNNNIQNFTNATQITNDIINGTTGGKYLKRKTIKKRKNMSLKLTKAMYKLKINKKRKTKKNYNNCNKTKKYNKK